MMQRFFNDLLNLLVGRSEKRFVRDLARELGIPMKEPEHGEKPKDDGKQNDDKRKR
jgi:hypothetical protein